MAVAAAGDADSVPGVLPNEAIEGAAASDMHTLPGNPAASDRDGILETPTQLVPTQMASIDPTQLVPTQMASVTGQQSHIPSESNPDLSTHDCDMVEINSQQDTQQNFDWPPDPYLHSDGSFDGGPISLLDDSGHGTYDDLSQDDESLALNLNAVFGDSFRAEVTDTSLAPPPSMPVPSSPAMSTHSMDATSGIPDSPRSSAMSEASTTASSRASSASGKQKGGSGGAIQRQSDEDFKINVLASLV